MGKWVRAGRLGTLAFRESGVATLPAGWGQPSANLNGAAVQALAASMGV